MDNKEKSLDRVTLIGFIALALVFVGIFGVYFIGQYLDEKGRKVESFDIGTVGDYKVDSSLYTYLFFNNRLMKEQEKSIQEPAASKTLWTSDKIDEKPSIDWLKEETSKAAREYVVYYNEALAAGIKDDDVKDDVEAMVKSNEEAFAQQQTTLEAFLLSQYHITLEQFKSVYTKLSVVDKYRTQLLDEAAKGVTDGEAEKHYNKNKSSFTSHVESDVAHVLFMTVDKEDNSKELSKADQKKAKEKADDILKRVRAGEDIKALAKKYSEDTGIKENGGVYTINAETAGQYVPEFSQFAYDNKVGDSKIVKTSYGYHVMKVLTKKGDTFKDSMEDVKKAIAAPKVQSDLDAKIKEKEEIKLNEDKVAGIVAVLVKSFNQK